MVTFLPLVVEKVNHNFFFNRNGKKFTVSRKNPTETLSPLDSMMGNLKTVKNYFAHAHIRQINGVSEENFIPSLPF